MVGLQRAIRSRRKGRAAETRPGFVDGYTGSSHLQKTQTAGPAEERRTFKLRNLLFRGVRAVRSLLSLDLKSRARVLFKVLRMCNVSARNTRRAYCNADRIDT